MSSKPMLDVDTVKANRSEWTCKVCGFLNTCWCFICHGCEDVTSLDG